MDGHPTLNQAIHGGLLKVQYLDKNTNHLRAMFTCLPRV